MSGLIDIDMTALERGHARIQRQQNGGVMNATFGDVTNRALDGQFNAFNKPFAYKDSIVILKPGCFGNVADNRVRFLIDHLASSEVADTDGALELMIDSESARFRLDLEKTAQGCIIARMCEIGNPRRIFDSASELIDGFSRLDEAIAGSVDFKLQPLMVLEDIRAGSIRVFLSSILKKIDDEGLRQGEIKKAIGPALVDAKYAAIGWLDKDQASAIRGASELRETLRGLAASSDLRQLGDYAPIHEAKLIAALDSLQNGKRLLGPKDKLLLEAPTRSTYKVDLTKTWDPAEAIPLPTTTTEKHSEGEIILTIRKPDMVGQSKWQFTRGKFPVFAKIADEDWLARFHGRKVIGLHSGDAMRCKVRFVYIFDDKGTMIEEQIEITKVIEIIEGSGGQQLTIPI